MSSNKDVRMSSTVYPPNLKQFFCVPWTTVLRNLQKDVQVKCVTVKGDYMKRK